MEEQAVWINAQAAMIVAVVAIVGSIISIIQTIIERYKWKEKFKYEKQTWELEFKNQQEKWEKEISIQKERWQKENIVELKTKFLYDLVTARYRTYPDLLKLLGTVRDVPDPMHKHYDDLKLHPDKLVNVANDLLKHLYGEAGLVMSMGTRNYLLLNVYKGCYEFINGNLEIGELVNYFFIARRKLREDIQIKDFGKNTSLDELVNKVLE